jgi:hypothetical protein
VSSLTTAVIAFACIFASGLLGMFIRTLLPGHHVNQESKDVVKLVMGLVATLAALVLGLLTASAKGEFDTQNNELQQSAAKIVALDRALAGYGTEAGGIRAALHSQIIRRLDLTWPEESTTPTNRVAKLDAPGTTTEAEGLLAGIRALAAQSDAQRQAQADAVQLARDILATRWLMFAQTSTPLPVPLLVVLVFWLSVLFLSFGLFAPRNATVIAAFLLSVAAVSGSLFLVLEMSRPFEGLIKVSSAPLRFAVTELGK